MKFHAVSLFLAFAIGAVCAQAQVSGGASHPKTSQLQSLSKQVDALTAQVNELRSAVAELQAKLATPDLSIGQSLLAGTYAVTGFQNELDPPVLKSSTNPGQPASVGSYVYTGTVTLSTDGTGSFTAAQTGSYLIFGQPSLASADQPPGTVTFDWTYASGIVTLSAASDPHLDGITFNVALGGQVMTHASANASDGTDVLIILTRMPATASPLLP
jgi:outer membrane murein-binding lipoprotein Lpp